MKARKGRPFDGLTKAEKHLHLRAEPRQLAAWKLAAAAEKKTLSKGVKAALDQWAAPWRKGGNAGHYLAFVSLGSMLVLWFFTELTG